jgi:hypothetical protein
MTSIDSTLAERGGRYGVFSEQARIAQGLKRAMASGRNWGRLADDQREALDMLANKMARILNGDPDYHDSWHDIIGYTKLVADRLEEQASASKAVIPQVTAASILRDNAEQDDPAPHDGRTSVAYPVDEE